MTDAFAIKGLYGIEANTVRDSAAECWSDWLIESELTRDVSEARGYRCVPVTVSEKGEAGCPPIMDLGDYYGVQAGSFIYMQRKAIRTATDAPMEDHEKAIITLCDYLSRKEQKS